MTRRGLAALTAGLLLATPAWAEQAPPPAAATNPDEALPAPQPVTVQAAELGRLLEGAAWISSGQGRTPFYTVGFRSCPDCVAMKLGAYSKLEQAGAEIRAILYARADKEGKPRSKPGERAMIAELWKTRSHDLWASWYETDPDTYYATETLPPAADGDAERTALVEKSRSFVTQLDAILAANDIPLYVPAMFWQENGQWMVYIGYDPETFDALIVSRLGGA